MTQGQATLVAAVIAATTALMGALAAGAVALRNETRRRRAAAVDSDRLALRSQAANLFVHLFQLQHEMEWLTWHAVNRPGFLDRRLAAAYESAVHAVYPKILGAMAVLASLDLELYQTLQPLVDQLYNVEGAIGELITGLSHRRERTASLRRLSEYHSVVKTIYVDFPPRLAEAMQYADRRYTTG